MKFLDRPSDPALEALAEEARREPGPELDWDRMQERLWRSIDQAQAPTQAKSRFGALWMMPALAVAAALALWFIPTRTERPIAHQPVPSASSSVDGDSLSAEELLQAGPEGLRISHRDRAEWTLEPNATARVLSHDHVVRVKLESGALLARVVPTVEKERFVVEAAETRVAVHGTVFRVVLGDDRSVVEVQEGVVAVGPLDRTHGATTLLTANSRAEFALSGTPLSPVEFAQRKPSLGLSHSQAVRKPTRPSTAPAPEAVSSVEPTSPVAEEPAPAPSSMPVSQTLTIGDVEAGVTPVVAAVIECFRGKTAGSGNLRVTAKSAITLAIASDGSIENVSFSPPLSPAVQSCSEQAISSIRFAPSIEGATVTRLLELTR